MNERKTRIPEHSKVFEQYFFACELIFHESIRYKDLTISVLETQKH